MDIDRAVEWCFATFAGRGSKSISVREFAERLSVLSMQWSGNFSPEDCLALAETFSEEDDPNLITIGSFNSAVSVGSHVVEASRRERSRNRARHSREEDRQARGDSGMSGEDVDVQSGAGFDAVEFSDDSGEFGRRVGDRSGQAASAAWEAILKRAAAEARSEGRNVLELFDSTTKKAAKRPEETARGSILADAASTTTTLTAKTLHRFLTKLDICVLPSHAPHHSELKAPLPPPPPTTATTTAIDEHDSANWSGDNSAQRSGHEAVRDSPFNATTLSRFQKEVALREGECRDRVDGGGGSGEGRARGGKYWDVSGSNSGAARAGRERGRTGERGGGGIGGSMAEGSPAASDRYLRQLSRDSASLRCRVQQYNGELARTTREAENLLSSSRNKSARLRSSSSSSSSVSDAGDSRENDGDGRERGLSRGRDFLYGDEEQSPTVVVSKNYRASSTKMGEGRVTVRGGGPPCLVSEVPGGGSDRETTIRRVTPLERPDPSHPRVDVLRDSPLRLRLRRHGGKLSQRPTDAHRSVRSSGVGDRRRRSSSTKRGAREEKDRRTALLLATLGMRDGKEEEDSASVSPTTPSEGARRFFNAAYVGPAPGQKQGTAVVTRFDPPTLRNGLTGLTMKQVDSVLLRVDGATPGSQSCWKSTEKKFCCLEPKQQRQQQQQQQHQQPQRGTRCWPGIRSAASLSRDTRERPGTQQMKRIAPGVEEEGEEEEEEEEDGESGTAVGGAAARPAGGGVKRTSALSSKTDNTWEQMKSVIKVPRAAKSLPWERKNKWDTARMKWVKRDNRPSEGGFKIAAPSNTAPRKSRAAGDRSGRQGGRLRGDRTASGSTKLHPSSSIVEVIPP